MSHQTSQEAYTQAETSFIARNPKSKTIYNLATKSLPGGNTRTVLYYDPFPLSIFCAKGSTLTDVDDHTYIDFLGEYTAGLYGHSCPEIESAITNTVKSGLSFGSHHEDEIKLAQLIQQRFPSMELLRFTNSGTEATLMALAVAKVYTKKSKILVFANAYHGGAFSFKGQDSSPVNAPHEYLIAKYNDINSVSKLVESNKTSIAAIIIEPMIGSGGCIPASHTFLNYLRQTATRISAVLIFDEVMTSRMHRGGGIQSQLPFNPDMTLLGKYFGGGLSFGAFGGKSEILGLFDPRSKNALAHAGTFNNNVLTMAAGRAGLEKVFTAERAEVLHLQGEKLRAELNSLAQGTRMKVSGIGSIMCFHFTRTPVEAITSHESLEDADSMLGGLLHLFLLEKGYYIARRGFVSLNLALEKREYEGFVRAVGEFVDRYRGLIVEGGSAKL